MLLPAAEITARRSSVHSLDVNGFCANGGSMLRWALGFLIIAVIAAFMGFTGVASTSVTIAKTLFYVFLVFFLVALVMTLVTGRRRSGSSAS
jgi:uncharacterized membrane protein YtjA (UPF0391 family)